MSGETGLLVSLSLFISPPLSFSLSYQIKGVGIGLLGQVEKTLLLGGGMGGSSPRRMHKDLGSSLLGSTWELWGTG